MDTPKNEARADEAATDDRDAGTLIAGRYRIVERIGDGAMGAVFLAEHEGLQRRVALKFLHDQFTGNTEVAARFAREAVAAARIAHPNVIAVHDSGVDEHGRSFLAMEYCAGEELRAVLVRDAPLSHDRALRIARQMAAALDHAHAMGIVHRDIKPENVLVVPSESGEVIKVIDFGIAKVHLPGGASNTALTRTGYVLGTPEYMAPEQGLGGAVDHRADLYAFAVIAYEMLVGRRPFDDDDVMVVIMRHINATPPAPSVARPEGGFTPAVDEVFARALAKSARDRFATATELVDALERALHAPAPTLPAPRLDTANGPAASRVFSHARSLAHTARARWLAASARARAVSIAVAALAIFAAGVSMRPRSAARVPSPTSLIALASDARRGGATPVRRVDEASLDAVMRRVATLRALPEFTAGNARERQRAATAFEAMRLDHRDDAAIAYVLGALYARDRATATQSLSAYRDALNLEPALAADPTLLGDVVRLFATTPGRAPAAEALLRGPLATTALDAMVDACARNAPGHPRLAALLAEPSFAPRLDATQRGLVALSAARTCESKRAAIEALGNEADARALAPLRRIPTGRGCGFLGLGTCNGCLGATLPAAIRAIESREPDGG
ncbi:MAG: protein kinase [Polyangiales bacterium]